MVFLQLGKELQSESIGELSSSPESADSSLSQTNSLTEVINDWRRELEEKNCLLKDRNSLIQSLEEQLKHRDEEISDMRENHQSVELDRDKNCQMVSLIFGFGKKKPTFVVRFPCCAFCRSRHRAVAIFKNLIFCSSYTFLLQPSSLYSCVGDAHKRKFFFSNLNLL